MRAATVVGACLLVCAGVCVGFHRADRGRIREIAEWVAAHESSTALRALALLHWVHELPGTRGNERYFGLPRLGATPAQILEGGGDCADRSRLLTALYREVGIKATAVMCFDPRSGRSTHTVVEARTGPGEFMVVDPAYGLYFPRAGDHGFYDLMALRRDPDVLTRRLDELIEAQGRHSRLRSYDRLAAGYSAASSINWNKNRIVQTLCSLLKPIWGEEVYRLTRPILVEEPHLAAAALLTSLGLLTFAAAALGNRARTYGSTMARRYRGCDRFVEGSAAHGAGDDLAHGNRRAMACGR